MEGAAKPAIFKPPKREVSAAMGAVTINQAVTSLLVAKQHEIFAEQFDGAHRARPGQLIDQRRRLPIHPHQFAARIFRSRSGDQVVLFLAHHGGVSSLRTQMDHGSNSRSESNY